MKKLFLAAMILCSLEKVYPLPVGNPSEASLFFYPLPCEEIECEPCDTGNFFSKFALQIGYYGDYVFQRNLETVKNRKIDYTQISTNAAYIALNICHFIDLFTTLGASHFKFNTSLGPFNPDNTSPRFDFESETTFSWSVGTHATLYEYKCVSLGIEGQYFASSPKPKALFVRTNVNVYPNDSPRKTYSEWQVGAGISYRYSSYFVPYAAVKYARACWDFDDEDFFLSGTTATISSLKSSKHWGYAVGVTLAPFSCKEIALTIEGRFADESALNFNAQFKF